MTNTEGTLAFMKAEEKEVIHPGSKPVRAVDIAQEAEGIRVITDRIYFHWQDLRPSKEEQQELYYALYGLKTLIEAHTEHAEQLYEAHPYE